MRFCPLFSGSSGNALFLRQGNTALLVDAGLAGSTVAGALRAIGEDPAALSGILVTHEHIDHVRGVGVLARRLKVPVYANEGTWQGMLQHTGPIPPDRIRMFETGREFYIGSIAVYPFKTPHDANESVGFAFRTEDGKKLSILTDVGHMHDGLFDAVSGSDLILIESNHDVEMLKVGPYPYPLKRRILGDEGHLSNDACGAALARLYRRGVKQAVLGHLSKENNLGSIALETVRACLRAEDIPDGDFALSLAYRDRAGDIYELE